MNYHRIHHRVRAEREYPDLAGLLLPALGRGDPLADAAIAAAHAETSRRAGSPSDMRSATPSLEEALHGGAVLSDMGRLVHSVRLLPVWADPVRFERAGRVFFRAGVFGGLTLALRCLVLGYAAPAGNKPLVLSGRLKESADRRLAETAQFARLVCLPGAMLPGGDGFRCALKVRLMHARVRWLAERDPRWKQADWGIPINQHDMLATILLFSNVFVDGLRAFGIHVSEEEADDFQHLYRWVGTVMGVEPDLLPIDYRQATRCAAFVQLTQGAPDGDGRELVRVLLEGPLRAASSEPMRRAAGAQVALMKDLCCALIGNELGRQLGLRRGAPRLLLPAVAGLMTSLEQARKRFALDDWVESMGRRYWETTVRRGLGASDAHFEAPSRLAPVG